MVKLTWQGETVMQLDDKSAKALMHALERALEGTEENKTYDLFHAHPFSLEPRQFRDKKFEFSVRGMSGIHFQEGGNAT